MWVLLTVVVLGVAAAVGGLVGWLQWSWLRLYLYHRHKGLQVPRPGLAELLAEVVAIARIGWWKLAGFGRDRLRIPAEVSEGPPVLCVHGFTQDGTNFWGLRRALERRGRPTMAVSLGLPPRSVQRYAVGLEQALEELVGRFGEVDVVAHSMGGVVLRHVLAAHPELAAAVRRIVTLGSPHRGTAGARGVPWLPEGPLLKRRSAWLAELPMLGMVAPHARRMTVAGGGDLVVYPTETCHEPGAVCVDLPGVGHAGLLARGEVIDVVVEALTEPAQP